MGVSKMGTRLRYFAELGELAAKKGYCYEPPQPVQAKQINCSSLSMMSATTDRLVRLMAELFKETLLPEAKLCGFISPTRHGRRRRRFGGNDDNQQPEKFPPPPPGTCVFCIVLKKCSNRELSV